MTLLYYDARRARCDCHRDRRQQWAIASPSHVRTPDPCFVAASGDASLSVWRPHHGTLVHAMIPNAHSAGTSVFAAAVHSHTRSVLSAGSDGLVQVFPFAIDAPGIGGQGRGRGPGTGVGGRPVPFAALPFPRRARDSYRDVRARVGAHSSYVTALASSDSGPACMDRCHVALGDLPAVDSASDRLYSGCGAGQVVCWDFGCAAAALSPVLAEGDLLAGEAMARAAAPRL